MPVSYAKWDNLDDSDDEGVVAPSPGHASAGRDQAMDEFLSLGRDASVAQIQET